MRRNVSGSVYQPFWQDFPNANIHRAITPDILHQLYQGVFKHLVKWCQAILGTKVLDQRICSLPPGFGLQQFKNGISALAQISGSERKNMAKILLACMQDKLSHEGAQAIKGLLDFIYLAQYPTHDDNMLGYLRDALSLFHKNKQYFINVQVRKHLNLPKLHSLLHYKESIHLFGTTDNFNTEMFEQLHIDFAKHGWRASNQRDEFPQMIQWLSCQEKIVFLRQQVKPTGSAPAPPTSTHSKRPAILIAKRPQRPNYPIEAIEKIHQAPHFSSHLKHYLNTLHTHPLGRNLAIDSQKLPFSTLDVFTNFRFQLEALQDEDEIFDSVKAQPPAGSNQFGRFDTVVYFCSVEAEATSMIGMFII